MCVLILVGGLGTRLRNMIKNMPKLMILIGRKPFLEYLILRLIKYNLRDIILCTGYLSEQIKRYFVNGSKWGVAISYSQEDIPLGTGGAIKLAENLIKEENFLVMNGDSFLDINLNKLMNFHLQKKALATMALTEIEDPRQYGTVEIDKNGMITKFTEKAKSAKSNLINGGIYVFNKGIFNYIPKCKKVSLETEIFPKLIGEGFYGMLSKSYFIDIGTPEDYKRLKETPHALLNLIDRK